MPLIEGVGDEVLQFVVMSFIIGMTLIAWMSTNARPNRYRTLLVMRSHTPHPVTVSIRSGVPNIIYTSNTTRGPADTVTLTTVPGPDSILNSNPIIPLQEMDSIVDADMALFENNRLHFYRRVEQPASQEAADDGEVQETEPASNEQIREMDSIVSAMEADMSTNNSRAIESPTTAPIIAQVDQHKDDDSKEPKPQATDEQKEATPDSSTEGSEAATETTETEGGDAIPESKKILIRLKYLNDTLKEVEGSLDEPLKDFKWRHFGGELARRCAVRLIHRGRVLADEGASLRALGLTHRAVVHAIVQPTRTQRTNPTEETPNSTQESGERAAERGWDLENILMTLVSVALTVVWFFRCEYSNMFTASASVALFGLTVFYSVAIFGLYLSDTFQFDRRPQPVPNN